MPAKISWLIKDKVVLLEVIGHILIEELEQIAIVGEQIINEADTPLLHLIIEEKQLTDFPKNVPRAIKATKQTLAHSGLGWMVFVNIPNDVIAFVTKLILSAAKTRIHVADSYEQAARMLMDVDCNLPDLQPYAGYDKCIPLYEINGSRITEYSLQ
ncbi:MAG: hypothetical protein CL607_09870 [Anaerolineaceae bacterium]|nr:hypothetical protein [Anaerolineaceae bacterium]